MDKHTNGRPASEGTWRRACSDAGCGAALVIGFIGIATTLVLLWQAREKDLFDNHPDLSDEFLFAVIPVLGGAVGLTGYFLFCWLRAPVRQRNEARKAIAGADLRATEAEKDLLEAATANTAAQEQIRSLQDELGRQSHVQSEADRLREERDDAKRKAERLATELAVLRKEPPSCEDRQAQLFTNLDSLKQEGKTLAKSGEALEGWIERLLNCLRAQLLESEYQKAELGLGRARFHGPGAAAPGNSRAMPVWVEIQIKNVNDWIDRYLSTFNPNTFKAFTP